MYDSFGGMIPLINIQLGEIIGGGVGMQLFVIISIFCWCSKLVRYSPTNVLTETGIGYRLRPSD
jgi:K+-transporting ATPase A subunit